MSPRSCAFRGVSHCAALLIALVLGCLSAGNVPAQTSSGGSSKQQAVAAIEEWISLSQRLREGIDPAEIDRSELLFARAFDPESLLDFVRTRVRYEPYAGVMRGRDGTLAVRAGSSVDQAILLASLLNDAGLEARLVRASLEGDMALGLLEQVLRVPPPQTPFKPEATSVVEDIIGFGEKHAGAAQGGFSDSLDDDEMMRRVARLQQRFEELLRQEGASMDDLNVPDGIIKEISDYFWVQYRLGPGDEWLDAHPVFEQVPAAFEDLRPAEFIKDSIPSEFQQRISVQFKALRRVGDARSVVDLTRKWERPVANMLDVVLTFRIVRRNGLVGLDAEEGDSLADIFLPMMGETIAPGAKAFTLGGIIVDADVAMSNMSGVFAEVSAKGANATSALIGIGSSDETDAEEATMEMEDVWLEIGLTTPNRDEPFRARRSLRDFESGHSLTRDGLVKEMRLEVFLGNQSVARRTDQLLRYQIEALELTLAQHAAGKGDGDYGNLLPKARSMGVDREVLESNIILASLAEYATSDDSGVHSYRDEPLILVGHRPMLPGSEQPAGVDIVHNSRRSFRANEDGEVRLSPSTTMEAGLWEAVSEAVILGIDGDNAISAVSVTEDGDRFDVLQAPSAIPPVESVGPISRDRIAATIEEGRWAIVPAGVEGKRLAWWDLDLETGELVGVTRNGWGGSFLVMAAPATEDVITRKVAFALTCIIAANVSCRSFSKFAVAAVRVALIRGGPLACEVVLFQLTPPGLPLPDVCDAVALAAEGAANLAAKIEEPIFKKCFELSLKQCGKAAAATP